MSKKIAQLTKVIFHLNTKNDESDLHLKTVQGAHENEIQDIIQNANKKVQSAWGVIERIKLENGGGSAAKGKNYADNCRDVSVHMRFKHIKGIMEKYETI